MDSYTFKIVLVGDGGVGKSSLVKRWICDEWDPSYDATLGVEVYPLCLQTNYGPIKFNIWDCAGQEKFIGLRDGYHIGAKGGLLVFDVASRTSYKNLSVWNRDVQRINEGIPMVVVGNKKDVHDRKVLKGEVTFPMLHGYNYVETSAKERINTQKPLLLLARKLTGKDDLTFV